MAPGAGPVLFIYDGTELQKMIRKIIYISILALVSAACSDEPVETVFFDLDTENGVFITCEGNFMYGNASLSFYNYETKNVQNDLFYARNNVPLGDVAQSMYRNKTSLFLVANNSGKIYAIDPRTAEFKGVITGLTSPRYIHFISEEKAYISDLYAHHITVFNPQTLEKTGRIDLTEKHTSEQMVQVGKYVFVSSWSYDNKILVIDTETDKLEAEIEVPLQPKDLKVDANNKIWVLSDGGFEGSSMGNEQPALTRIDPETFTVEKILRFERNANPYDLELNSAKDTLCFINQGVCKMAVNSKTLPVSVFIPGTGKLFYSMGINPQNDEIYVSDAIDYTQDAIIYRYSQSGVLVDSFKVGVNPSDFLFR
jgi:YVTN family beta-propeller protein